MPFAWLSLCTVLASPLGDSPALELRYDGSVAAIARDGGADEPGKRFSLYCLLVARDGGRHDCAFVVDEQGAGGWAWPERFGLVSFDGMHNPTARFRAQLLYDHNDSPHPLALRQPLFEHAGQLEEGAEWTAGDRTYEVVKSAKVGDRACWQVDIGTGIGTEQTLWIEKERPLLVKVERRLTMGRGDQFLLRMELAQARGVEAGDLERFERPLQTLVQLQKDLKRDEDDVKPDLKDSQIQAASKVVEQLEKEAESTPFGRLAAVIARDVKTQSRRSDDVAGLAKRFLGQPAPPVALRSLANQSIDPDELKGKIVLLHFWDYRGEPFPAEPYGQVGYLDFLNSRRRKLGVQVYGVAVDGRVADPEKTQAVVRSVRKLQTFMNLSYPLALDDGTLLQKFGDPQRLGAKLPLWVLIAPDGTIAEYKVGNYDIQADEGLKQLDAAVVKLIKKQRPAEPEKK